MKRVFNFKMVEGDPNEVTHNEVLIVKDPATGKIKDIQKRDSKTGKMASIISESNE